MLGVDRRALHATWTVVVVAGALWLLYQIRFVVFLLLVSILFAYLIWPLVEITEKGWRRFALPGRPARLPALAVVYPVLFGAMIFAATQIAPRIASQAEALVERGNALADEIKAGHFLERVSVSHGWSLETLLSIRDELLRNAGSVIPYLQSLTTRIIALVSSTWALFLVPVFAFFLIKDAERLVAEAVAWVKGEEQRALLRAAIGDLHQMLGLYARGLLVLSFLDFAVTLLFLFIAGAPYALLLATAAAMLEFIPVAGPLVAALLVVVTAWLAGYPHILLILIFLGVWRLLQDYVNVPLVVGRGVELNPLLLIAGVLAGAEVAGIAGAFLAMPVLIVTRVVVVRYRPQAVSHPGPIS